MKADGNAERTILVVFVFISSGSFSGSRLTDCGLHAG